MADIFESGYSSTLERTDAYLQPSTGTYKAALGNSIENEFAVQSFSSGSMISVLNAGKDSFTSTTTGYRMGIDLSDDKYKWIIGDASGSIDWNVTTANTLTINGAGLVASTIRYGKTSLTDSTNAGYYLGTDGVYIGSASDATYIKYTVSTGSFDLVGTISGRSTATVAASINASGQFVSDIVNARLNSSSKAILADFNFGSTDYAGAVKSGDITWNATTGAITGGSGVVVYRGGIIGAAAGVATFTLDATTGSATFAGTLSAAAGTLGSITAGSFSGVAITGGTIQTATSGQRIRIKADAGTTPTTEANSFALIDSSNNVLCAIGSDAGYLLGLNSISGVQALNIQTAATHSNALIYITDSYFGATGATLSVYSESTSSSTTVQFQNTTTDATTPALTLLTAGAIATHFKKPLKLNGYSIWTSDTTDPNGALTGVRGDICLNCDTNGKIKYCSSSPSGTVWV